MAANLTSKELETLPDEELARIESLGDKNSRQDILIREEWKRRLLLKQHALNESIIKTQHDLNLIILGKQLSVTKWAIIIGLIGTITGAIIGSMVTFYLATKMSSKQQQTQVHQQILLEKNIQLHDKEISNHPLQTPK